MSQRQATSPMSAAATSGADDEFYRRHPERLNADGTRQPLDRHSPADAQLRKEWMDLYVAKGGEVETPSPKKKAHRVRNAGKHAKANGGASVTSPVATCPYAAAPKPKPEIIVQAPKPDKPPVPCGLESTTIKCSHRTVPTPDNWLMVVPHHAFGDDITCVAKPIGGCGNHVEWTIGGYWNSTAKGASTSFPAEPGTSPVTAWLNLYNVEPHVYRVSAETCESSSPTVEIRCYPAGEVKQKLAVTGLQKKIHEALKIVPIDEEEKHKLEKSFFQGAVEFKEQWKEDKGSARAYCDTEVKGGFNPLAQWEREFPVLPLTLIPPFLDQWVKAGVYFKATGGLSFNVKVSYKYWGDTRKYQFSEHTVELEGQLEGQLTLNGFLLNKKLLEIKAGGKTNLSGKGEVDLEEEPWKIKFDAKWSPLIGIFTLEALDGAVEYEKSYPFWHDIPVTHKIDPTKREEEGAGGEE
jgi:hypothetical protein